MALVGDVLEGLLPQLCEVERHSFFVDLNCRDLSVYF